MKRRLSYLLLALGLVVCGCSEERGLAPVAPTTQGETGTDTEAIARALFEQAGWPIEATDAQEIPAELLAQRLACPLTDFEREVINGHIVHYSVQVRVGPGQYDVIGLHRVVRENRPYRPIRTRSALFMLHGDLKNFETMFMPGKFSPHLPNDFGIAVYLAEQNVDVWGITQGWNLVPAEETDFSFFADWGIEREVDHLEAGIGIARLARWLGGNGLAPMLVLGYSSGCVTGYALLDQESQRPLWQRQVKGFVAADCGVHSDDPNWETCWAGYLDFYQTMYDSGQYEDPLFFRDAAIRARTDPDGASPYVPGLTNLQCVMYFGGGPIFYPTAAHYHAPILEDGFPVDFRFVTIDQWLDFLENTAAYEPIRFYLDYCAPFAGLDSPFFTHLSDITIPVLDIGGAGGIAPFTAATVSQLGSDDITQLYVSTGGPIEEEYGHIDIFTASNSPELVWQPVLEWVEAH